MSEKRLDAKNRWRNVVVAFRMSPEEAQELFALECRAADLYALALPRPLPCGMEYTGGMVKA